MKPFFIVFTSMLFFTVSSFAFEQSTNKFWGFDKLGMAKDCSYRVYQDFNDNRLAVISVHSNYAGGANVDLKIPVQSIPLKNGFAMTDVTGFKITYSEIQHSNGRLIGELSRSGAGLTKDKISVEFIVSSDLKNISKVTVLKQQGIALQDVYAQLECIFQKY